MDKIIFNNVVRGFPADENFMRMVDYNRLALLDVCKGIFGSKRAVVSGAEVSMRAAGGRAQVTISSGILWTGDDLVKVKKSMVLTTQPEAVYINIKKNIEKNTFHDGVQYDAYERNEGVLTSVEDETPPADAIYLYSLHKINTLQPDVSKIFPTDLGSTGLNIRGSLQQTVYSDGRVNIRGLIVVLNIIKDESFFARGIKVARLPIINADVDNTICSNKMRLNNVYPAAITFETDMRSLDDNLVSFAHFVKMEREGGLYIHIPYRKIKSLSPTDGHTWDAFISVDFTYNGGK